MSTTPAAVAEDASNDAVEAALYIPYGTRLPLRGRGTTFVREMPGEPGAPTVLLLHGWMATGAINWFQAFPSLTGYRVLTIDHRGHGRGIRTRRRFRLADCADDAAAVLDRLGTGPVVAVGYSLGGPVAQLLWRRHPDLVAGLVLCATSHRLMPGSREQMIFGSMMALTAGTTRLGQLATRAPARQVRAAFERLGAGNRVRPDTMRAWARAETRRHDWRLVTEAGWAMANYRAPWVSRIDVPTTVVVTTKDRAVGPHAQLRMALRIPDARIQRIDDGHLSCAKPRFGPAIRTAVDDVVARASLAAVAPAPRSPFADNTA